MDSCAIYRMYTISYLYVWKLDIKTRKMKEKLLCIVCANLFSGWLVISILGIDLMQFYFMPLQTSWHALFDASINRIEKNPTLNNQHTNLFRNGKFWMPFQHFTLCISPYWTDLAQIFRSAIWCAHNAIIIICCESAFFSLSLLFLRLYVSSDI